MAKISDFGLSLRLYQSANTEIKTNVVPIRWMAPEVLLHHSISPMSDVWSYGVVLWEIFSFGMEPYGAKGE